MSFWVITPYSCLRAGLCTSFNSCNKFCSFDKLKWAVASLRKIHSLKCVSFCKEDLAIINNQQPNTHILFSRSTYHPKKSWLILSRETSLIFHEIFRAGKMLVFRTLTGDSEFLCPSVDKCWKAWKLDETSAKWVECAS